MVAVPDTVALPRAFLTATGSGLPRDGLHGNVNHQQTEKEERLNWAMLQYRMEEIQIGLGRVLNQRGFQQINECDLNSMEVQAAPMISILDKIKTYPYLLLVERQAP